MTFFLRIQKADQRVLPVLQRVLQGVLQRVLQRVLPGYNVFDNAFHNAFDNAFWKGVGRLFDNSTFRLLPFFVFWTKNQKVILDLKKMFFSLS